jgi:hypothetical protein
VEEQEREERSLLAAAHLDRALVVENLERTEDPKVHWLRLPRRS